MRAARLSQPGGLRRGALGASLTLHGALAAAAILPFMGAETFRPPAPVGLDVVWIPPAAHGAATDTTAERTATDTTPAPDTVPTNDAEQASLAEAAQAVPATLPEPPPSPVPTGPARPDPATPPLAEVPTEPAPPTALPDPAPAQTASLPPRPATSPQPERATRPARAPARPSARSGDTGADAATGAAAITPASLPVTPPPGPVLVTTPRYRSPPTPPAYPPRALELGLSGTVLARARVGADGSTEEIRLWRTSGHPLLDAAALAAVRRWAFEPASLDGRRVEAWVEVPVHFRLN